MSSVRTITEFSSALDSDKTWRIREISDIKSAILRADSISQKALLRALVPICYAHWEGFVKNASSLYMSYIVQRKNKYIELSHSFMIGIYMSGIKKT